MFNFKNKRKVNILMAKHSFNKGKVNNKRNLKKHE